MRLLQESPSRGRAVVVLRHSERPSFDGVPMKDWNGVGLTPEGFEAAERLGRSLVERLGISNLRSYGWGLKRCQDTSRAIAKGAKDAGGLAAFKGEIGFVSPIADRTTYDAILGTPRFEGVIMDWLRRKEQGVYVPIDKYSSLILGQLIKVNERESEAAIVIATHDLHILPIVSSIFGRPIRNVGYLDGPVLRMDGEAVHAGFEGSWSTFESNGRAR